MTTRLVQAIERNCSIRTIRACASHEPASLTQPSANGDLPLHVACRSEAPVVDVLQWLLTAYPAAIHRYNGKGETPLHLLAQGRAFTVERIQLFAQINPNCLLWVSEKKGTTVLHDYLDSILERTTWDRVRHDFVHNCHKKCNPSVLQYVTSIHSTLFRVQDRSKGRTPLHIAVAHNDAAALVQFMLSVDPECISVVDHKGSTALHTYLYLGSSCTRLVLDVFLSVWSDILLVPDQRGHLPLHIACSAGVPMDVIRTMVRVCPDTVAAMDRKGLTPLHVALQQSDSGRLGKLVDCLLASTTTTLSSMPGNIMHAQQQQQALKCQNEEGMTALHFACQFAAPLDVCKALVRQYPDGIAMVNHRQETALHIAAKQTKPRMSEELLSVIEMLVSHSPLAGNSGGDGVISNAAFVNQRDWQGMTPLHRACESMDDLGYFLVFLNAVYTAHPGTVETTDTEGRTPLHILLAEHCFSGNNYTEARAVDVLLMKFPEALWHHDKQGCTPLHRACENRTVGLDILRILTRHSASVALQKNNQGLTPLHIVVNQRSLSDSMDIVPFLIQTYPAAAKATDMEGRTPLHFFLLRNHSPSPLSLSLLDSLVRTYPQAMAERDHHGVSPLHVALQNGMGYEYLHLMTTLCPVAVSVKDKYGRTPLLTACQWNAALSVIHLLVTLNPTDAALLPRDVAQML